MGHWHLENLTEVTFQCHFCNRGGFPNIDLLNEHCFFECKLNEDRIILEDEDEDNHDSESESETDEDPGRYSVDIRCPVCMSREVNQLGKCGHAICSTCSGKVKGANCPICRNPWIDPRRMYLYKVF